MIKGSIQEEDITIINIYAPNIEAPQYVRQNNTVTAPFLHNRQRKAIVLLNYNM